MKKSRAPARSGSIKIIIDIVHDVTYEFAKFHYEILCFVGYIKTKTLIKM
jgi:hypothetical protein